MTDLVEFMNTAAVWPSHYLKGDDSMHQPPENRDSPGKELPTKSQRLLRSQNRKDMAEQLNIDEDHQSRLNSTKCACTQTSDTSFNQYREVRKRLNQAFMPASLPPSSLKTELAEGRPSSNSEDMPLNLTMNVQDSTTSPDSPSYASSRPSVITCAPINGSLASTSPDGSIVGSLPSPPSPSSPNGPIKQEGNPVGICDPAIDEHFRRSLGKNYPEYAPPLPPTNPAQSKPEVSITGTVDDHFAKSLGQKWEEIKAKNEGLDLDIFGSSVDDHFAKALGDTWQKIKAQHDGCKNSACSSPPSSPSSSVVST